MKEGGAKTGLTNDVSRVRPGGWALNNNQTVNKLLTCECEACRGKLLEVNMCGGKLLEGYHAYGFMFRWCMLKQVALGF